MDNATLRAERMAQKLRKEEFDVWLKRLMEDHRFSEQLSEGADYRIPYLILFNGITDAIHAIDDMNFGKAKRYLKYAQCDAEEAFISMGEDEADPDEDCAVPE